MSEHVGRIAEDWSDQARAAAIEARRAKRSGIFGQETKAERAAYGIVHVEGNTRFGPGPHIGDFQSFTPDGRHADVRLHLEDDHPAVQDAMGDNPEMHPDQFEFIDSVPVEQLSAYGKDISRLGDAHASEMTAMRHQNRADEIVLQNIDRRAALQRSAASQAAAEARRRELRAGLRTTPR